MLVLNSLGQEAKLSGISIAQGSKLSPLLCTKWWSTMAAVLNHHTVCLPCTSMYGTLSVSFEPQLNVEARVTCSLPPFLSRSGTTTSARPYGCSLHHHQFNVDVQTRGRMQSMGKCPAGYASIYTKLINCVFLLTGKTTDQGEVWRYIQVVYFLNVDDGRG